MIKWLSIAASTSLASEVIEVDLNAEHEYPTITLSSQSMKLSTENLMHQINNKTSCYEEGFKMSKI